MMMRNKKGFLSVYLCLFFLTLVSVILLIVGNVKSSVWQSNGETLGHLWGQSVLAEYDLNLQRRYGLFGFYGYPALVKDKLEFYATEALDSVDKNISWKIQGCSLYGYSLQNVDIFKEQVLAEGSLLLVDGGEKWNMEIQPVIHHEPGNRSVVLDDLPSSGSKDGLSLHGILDAVDGRTTLSEVAKKGNDRYIESAYAFSCFRHGLSGKTTEETDGEAVNGESYFSREIEYLICGKNSDDGNAAAIRNRIVGVREAMNLLYLNENEQTRNEALVVAELLTPGPAAVVTQQTLLSMWALAESVNDYRLLMNGHRVPLVKSEETWAVDLESAMEDTAEGYIYTGVDEGENYEDYLKFFLSLVNERLCLLRMMDLIQINMRWLYYDSFLLGEYYGGLQFQYTVQGKTHNLVRTYEKEK